MRRTFKFHLGNFDSLTEQMVEAVEGTIDDKITERVDPIVQEAVDGVIADAVEDLNNRLPEMVDETIADKVADLEGFVEEKVTALSDSVDARIADLQQDMADRPTEAEVQTMIDNSIAEHQAAAEKIFDDTKVYRTYENFPGNSEAEDIEETPREDVLYIDGSDGRQYIWNGTEYEPLSGVISNSSIEDLVRQSD